MSDLSLKSQETSQLEKISRVRRQSDRQRALYDGGGGSGDDEEDPNDFVNYDQEDGDVDDDYGDEGSGDVASSVADEPVFVRITFKVVEEWSRSLADRNSPEAEELAKALEERVAMMYEAIPGVQTVNVVRFRATDTNFEFLVVLDLGSKGNGDTSQLKSVFSGQLSQGRVGDITVKRAGNNDDDWWRVIAHRK